MASEGEVKAQAAEGQVATATVAPATAVVHEISHEKASDLPELSWGWRRAYVFLLTVLVCAHVGWISQHVTDLATLRMTIRNDQGIIVLIVLLYLAGASAEKIVQLLQAARTTRKETITSTPPPAA